MKAGRSAMATMVRMKESIRPADRFAMKILWGPLTAENEPCPCGVNQMLEAHTRNARTSTSNNLKAGRGSMAARSIAWERRVVKCARP